jgi:cytochrome c oxidase assembly protein subunit 15
MTPLAAVTTNPAATDRKADASRRVSPARGASSNADWRVRLSPARRRRLRIWFWSIAAATFLVLVVGGVTRLTQSGLSIVNWQPLVGVVPPLSDAAWQERFDQYRQFPQYVQLRRDMTLADFKVIFFWEYLHRMLARLIGLLFVVPLAAFWLAGYLSRPLAVRALALFALGSMQGAMGWLMVKSGLVDRPSVSHFRLAAHLGLAFLIFGGAVWLARELAAGGCTATVAARTRVAMRRGLAAVGIVLGTHILWGALVAGLKAGLVYNTFPLMAGRIVPPDVLALATAPGAFLQNLATVQWMHRLLGTMLLGAAALVFVRVRRIGDRRSLQLNAILALMIAAQYVIGILTLLFGVPLALGVIHQAFAMLIAGVWVVWAHHVRNVGIG